MDRRFRMPDPATGKIVALDMKWVGWAAEAGGDPFRIAFAVDACRALMDANGLDGWDLDVSHARNRAGSMRYHTRKTGKVRLWDGKPGTLILSGPLMSLWDDVQQIRIILHEIAHALCPDDGHGPVWQGHCRRLGIRPERCWGSNGEARAPVKPRPYAWIGTCPGGHVHRRKVRPSRRLACLRCNPVPQERFVITWEKVQDNDSASRIAAADG